MKPEELIEMGFSLVDENEYTDGKYTIFVVSDKKISILGEDEYNFLSVPEIKISNRKELESFLMLIDDDFQSKD